MNKHLDKHFLCQSFTLCEKCTQFQSHQNFVNAMPRIFYIFRFSFLDAHNGVFCVPPHSFRRGEVCEALAQGHRLECWHPSPPFKRPLRPLPRRILATSRHLPRRILGGILSPRPPPKDHRLPLTRPLLPVQPHRPPPRPRLRVRRKLVAHAPHGAWRPWRSVDCVARWIGRPRSSWSSNLARRPERSKPSKPRTFFSAGHHVSGAIWMQLDKNGRKKCHGPSASVVGLVEWI